MGTSCAVFRCVSLVALVAMCGCGPSTGVTLTGLDVTLVQTQECTQTGVQQPSCTDEAELAKTSTTARWIISRNDDDVTLAVTTDNGSTLPGVSLENNGVGVNTTGCAGEGGECVFARRRMSSTDPNTGCQTFDELFVVGHFPVDDERTFIGAYNAVAGASEACGTFTENVSIFAITGTVVDEPVLALEEAQ